MMTPWNTILSSLDFFTQEMPNYPISFVISFAVNGVMVLVILVAIAFSEYGSHATKVNLMFFLTAITLVMIPFVV